MAVEEALAVARGVPVAETVLVLHGLREAEALRVWVAEPVPEPVALPVARPVPEPAPLREPLAVVDKVAVGEALNESEVVAVPEPVALPVAEAAPVPIGLREENALCVWVAVPVPEQIVEVAEGVVVTVAMEERESVPECVGVSLVAGVGEGKDV